MYLVQLLLPLYNNTGEALPGELYVQVRDELVRRHGGVTVYKRAPASGLWQNEADGQTVKDDLVIYEVMVDTLDEAWWRSYRTSLELSFQQQALLIRAHQIQIL